MSDLHNQNAEAGVICAALHSPSALQQLSRTLTPDDFYIPAHEAIWDTIRVMLNQDQLVDPITIMSGLAKRGYQKYQSIIIDIATMGVVDVQGLAYANDVKDLAVRRRLSTSGLKIQQLVTDPEESPKTIAALALQELETAYRPIENSKTHIGDYIDGFLDELENTEAPQGISWPYKDAARVLRPMSSGQFGIIAARPAMGKSVCLADIARHAAIKERATTIVFSLEMSSTEYLMRIVAAEAKVPLSRLQNKTLDEHEWQRIADATNLIREAPLHIIDDPECTLNDIRGHIKNLRADLACIDYIQLGTFNPKIARREGLEEFSRGLKITAKKFGIPIITAAQLNRGSGHERKKPQISDLRESGALEQDADFIILLDREDYYEPESPRAGEIDLIVGKQRSGPTGLITLAHQFHYARFKDLAN